MAPTKLPSRPLGKNGPEVARLGLGLMGISVAYGPAAPDEDRLAFLDKAYELGEIFWDTANIYGDSEDLIGRWLAANPEKRQDIFLATKFGSTLANSQPIDSSPENCRNCLERSLQRLGLPSVDLFYIHRVDGKGPIEATMRTMVELKNEGKFKYIGISDCTAATLRRAHAIHPISCIQVEYSPFQVEIEGPDLDLLQTARELGVAIVAYSPLGKGILTGKYRTREDIDVAGSVRPRIPWFQPENLDKNLALVDKIVALAEAKGVTSAQLTLAWILAQGDDFFAIPGTSKIDRMEENLGAFSVSLGAEEEKQIHQVAAEVWGIRLPPVTLAYSYKETPEE
ncbi:aldo-keto reductase, putative [Xylariales sp. PMI_506]|nr:aldo-keto reductase, putative [Xylariales sp. PMI_506]